jgi:predicted membrane-bound mannosyltransferase
VNIRPLAPYFFLLLILWAGQARAQTIYKCILDGKTSYGEARCAADAAQQVLISAAATAPAASAERSERLHQQAEQLTKQRNQREAREAQAQQRADKIAAKKQGRCASLKLQRQWAEEDAERAVRDKNAAKAALKARRAEQKLAMACPD